MSTVPALQVQRLAKIYGRTAALKALSFALPSGQTLALLGHNGSGKTTLLKVVAGAITPTLGSGAVYGRDLVAERTALRSVIGLLAGENYLYEDLTAAENLVFAGTMAGHRWKDTIMESALERVDLVRQAGDRVRTFSSGMKRRLALARTDLLAPRLLLLDEPYNSLDADGAGLVDDLVRRTVQGGGAAILATHDADRALALADLVAVLERGKLVHFGPATAYRTARAKHVG